MKKKRIFIVFVSFLVIGIGIYQLFFMKMEFIKSEVYADLYLIKNPDKNKERLHQTIKKEVLLNKDAKKLRFYEYSHGKFLEEGTAYFVKHSEKPQGMFPKLLENYPEYLLAIYSTDTCSGISTSRIGKLEFYENKKITEIDTLFNSCKK